jgi:hypothetical protein
MTDKPARNGEETIETAEPLNEELNKLQREIEKLETELKKAKRRPSGRIGVVFIVLGALSLITSIINIKELLSQTPLAPIAPSITGNTQVLAFIGLGLILWGGLFLLARPVSYVRSSLLEATAISTYATIDRIRKDLKFNSKSYYIPPYPKEVYIPEHLKGLKEMIAFISANGGTELPSIEQIAESRFMIEKPKGMIVTPPGHGLMEQFEKELRQSFTTIDIEDLYEILPKIIAEDLQLAKEVTMETEENLVHLKIVGSIYKALCYEADIQSVRFLGSPLVSAIACAIAKTTGKPVTIQETEINPVTETMDVTYRIIDV